MDTQGTFIGTLDSKITYWDNKIKNEQDPSKRAKFENEMYGYLTDCLPYILEYTKNCDEVIEEGPFNTKITKGIKRKEVYYDYLRNVEKASIPFSKIKPNIFSEECPCGSSNVYVDNRSSNNVCQDCGLCVYFLGEELTYKEEQETSEKIVNNSYKRDNHLNEWILQFQGREMTNIPNEVIEQLRSEFKKQKIKDVTEINQAKVKILLRKLRLSKYYEHSTYITNILNGLNPPTMSANLEDRLRHMFREIQEPFAKHCPANRSNFLSYSYVLYKFCELLGEDDYLPYFPLLKSKEKLRQQDVIWKGVCSELLWEYIPTC